MTPQSLPAILVAVATAAAFAGCRDAAAPRDVSALSLVVAGDTEGWIIPCGCTSNQSGGLLRRGTFIEQLREQGAVLLADAGGAPSGTSPYDRAKFEAIAAGSAEMGLAAHNIGAGEAALGIDYLRRVGQDRAVPFISCNVRDGEGKLVAEPLRIVEAGGRRIALAGVLSERYATDGLHVDPPQQAILSALETEEGNYDALIVLAYLPEEELRTLAAGLPEADAVVGGPTGQAIAPERVGPSLLASATNKGKFLAVLRWPEEGGRWEGEVVEMDNSFADHDPQQANLQRFYEVLLERDFSPTQTSFLSALPASMPAGFRIAGTASCRRCHGADCAHWDDSRHAHAWDSLQETGAQVDAYCQQCHTTGYGLPGGFVSHRQSVAQMAVGCESCHGPSHAHSKNPRLRTAWFGQAGGQCTVCHDAENSPDFHYDSYWDQIVHGEPADDET